MTDPMAPRPKIQLVAYEEHRGGSSTGWIFLAIPGARGRYLRTDACAAEVSCPVCEAVPGEPCLGRKSTSDGYGTGTHWKRREAWRALQESAGRGLRIETELLKDPTPEPREAPPAPVALVEGTKVRPCPVCGSLVRAWAGRVRSHLDRSRALCGGTGRPWGRLAAGLNDGGKA